MGCPATPTGTEPADDLERRTDPDDVGPKKMSEHYAYLAVHPRHVN